MRNLALLVMVLFLTAGCAAAQQDSVAGDQATAPTATVAPPPAAAAGTPTGTPSATPSATLLSATEEPQSAPADQGVALPTATPSATPAAAGAPVGAAGAGAAVAGAGSPPAVPDLAAVSVRLEPLVENVEQPLFVTHAGDGSGRLFVLEKTGKIRVVQDGVLLEAPFLDISGKVSLASEQGLLGLAFAPDYASNGVFYLNYTNAIGDTVISRFTVAPGDPNRADPASELLILQLDQPAPNHNGGMIAFGPDGYLWIGMGDGGAANDRFGNGQNPQTLLGKMLRISTNSDPDEPYAIPPDNPWMAAGWNGQDVRDEIWAVGLRNPWRWSFDRQTGDLWIADVGQNTIEEVNVVLNAASTGGLNFGWPIMEGKSCFQAESCDQAGLTLPVADYRHEGDCAVTGGYVYRGQAHPAWTGVYFYGDYCSGRLWALAPDGSGGWNGAQLAQLPLALSSFGEDEAGELYITDLAGGVVYRMIE